MRDTAVKRYNVCASAGAGFQVWDRYEHRIVATRRTFAAAQREAKRRNTSAEPVISQETWNRVWGIK